VSSPSFAQQHQPSPVSLSPDRVQQRPSPIDSVQQRSSSSPLPKQPSPVPLSPAQLSVQKRQPPKSPKPAGKPPPLLTEEKEGTEKKRKQNFDWNPKKVARFLETLIAYSQDGTFSAGTMKSSKPSHYQSFSPLIGRWQRDGRR
jgi:hypothetical protein